MATGGTIPQFVSDGIAPRVFLGPLAMFQNQQGMMVNRAQHPAMTQIPQSAASQLQGQAGTTQLQGQSIAAPVPNVASGPARGTRRQAGKIPRPLNAWILYRKHFHSASIRDHPELNNNQICKSSG
jgi:HMG (high mobility group) box